jgi:hypothetical protein
MIVQNGNDSSTENVTQVYQRISTLLAIKRGVSGALEAKVLTPATAANAS